MAPTSIRFDSGKLSELIGLGYDAGLTRSAWLLFADKLAAASGSDTAMIQYHDHAHPEHSFLLCSGLGSEFEQAFAEINRLGDDDQFWAAIRSQPSGTIKLSQEIMSADARHKSPAYRRVAKPWRLEHFLISAIDTDNGISAFLSLGRTDRRKPFVAGDKSLFGTTVLPHLRRSFALHRAYTTSRETNIALSAVIDLLPYGIVVFDNCGRPVAVNNWASTIFNATQGLALINGRLHASDPAAQTRLEAALQAALATSIMPPDTVVIPRKGHTPPYQVVFSQLGLHSDSEGFPVGSTVLALIHEGWVMGSRYVPTVLRYTYRLTRAEIHLCQAMLDGKSLPGAASTLGISRNTAKTHLARIFDKTGVRSQPALLRLLSTGNKA